jgi:hypothetical protein
MKLRIVVLILIAASAVNADAVIHKFGIWGDRPGWTKVGKLHLYLGWTNGFFYGPAAEKLGGVAKTMDLATCLTEMGSDQAIAMIDKYYQQHPERWSEPMSLEFLRALTMNGGPCQGKGGN